MSTSVFGIAISGLNAAQIGLSTTAHNIANANTPGYNRQTITQTTQLPDSSGSGFEGRGVEISTITRIYNQYISQQVNSATAQNSYLTELNQQLSSIDNMLADPTTGFSPALQNFFQGVQAVAATPASVPARQSMLGDAQSMVNNLQTMDSQLSSLNDQVNSSIDSTVTQINGLASQIAKLNNTIINAQGASSGQPANDLLDQRDELVTQLNQLVNANVIKQGDGSYNISIGNGQSLVVGDQTFTLGTTASAADPTQLAVAYQQFGATSIIPDQQLTGGSLGALLDFRVQALNPTRSQIGQIALSVASAVNQQNKLGLDLNGNNGGNIFQIPLERVDSQTVTTPQGQATLTATNLSNDQFVSSDFNLSFNGSTYSITQLTSGQTSQGISPASLNAGISVFGVKFQLQLTNPPASAAIPDAQNTGSATINVSAPNSSNVTGGAYKLVANANSPAYTLTSLNDGTAWTSDDLQNWQPVAGGLSTTTPGGLQLSVGNNGQVNPGDSFLVDFANLTANQQVGISFKPAASAVIDNADNTGTATLQVAIASTSSLTGSDYQLKINSTPSSSGGLPFYTLTRSSDGSTWTSTDMKNWQPASGGPSTTTPDGLQLQFTAGTQQTGDQYTIQPTRNTIQQMSMAISDPSQIAAAIPISASSDTASISSTAVAGNTGSATVTTLTSAIQGQGGAAVNPVTISFNDYLEAQYTAPGASTVNIIDAKTGAQLESNVQYNPNTPLTYQGQPVAAPGNSPGAGVLTYNLIDSQSGTILQSNLSYTPGNAISYNGWQVSISGYPNPGDAFAVTPQTNTGNASISPGSVGQSSYQFYTSSATAVPSTVPGSVASGATVTVSGNGPLQGGASLQNVGIAFPYQVQFIPAPNGNPPTSYNIVNVMNGNVVAANQTYSGQANISYAGGTVAIPAINGQPVDSQGNPENDFTIPSYVVFADSGTAGSPSLGQALTSPQGYAGQNIAMDGWTATINGTPTAGDVFQVSETAQLSTPGMVNVANQFSQLNSGIQQPVEIQFVTPTSYQIVDPSNGNVLQLARPNNFASGNNISYNGWTTQISGTPAKGDVFLIEPNTDGVADNRNMVALGQLQTSKVMLSNTASFQSAYSQIVSSIGVQANQATTNQTAQATLLQQVTTTQQSLSGVNLDEEASNLVIYQQAYEASSKVIQIAQQAFQQILSLGT